MLFRGSGNIGKIMKKYWFFIFVFHPLAMGTLDSFLEVLSGSKTHYEVLDLPRDCSRKDIVERYSYIVKMLNSGNYYLSETEKEEVIRAYNTLKDPSLRAQYDAWIDSEEYQEEFKRKPNDKKKV